MNENFENIPINEFAEPAYLGYAMKVVKERAIPDIEDGLKPGQRRILYAMHQLKLLPSSAKPMKSARVVGDCFVKGALVSTETGLKPIEELVVGDKVLAPSGELCNVVESFHNINSDIVEVCFESGKSIKVTPGQLFRVLNNDLSISWCEAKNLEGKTVLRTSGFQRNIKYEDSKKAEELSSLAYITGIFVAEGSLADRGRPPTRVSASMVDEEVIDSIEKTLKSLGKNPKRKLKKYHNPNWKDSHLLRVSGVEQLFEACLEKSNKKCIPQWILNDRSLYAAFLAGFTDGDGHFRPSPKKEVDLVTVSGKLARQLSVMLSDLGISSSQISSLRAGTVSQGPIVKNYNFDLLSVIITGRHATEFARLVLPYLKAIKNIKKCQEYLKVNYPHPMRCEAIPSKIIWDELTKHHIGAGWYKDIAGKKFRLGIKCPTGSKIRYSHALRKKYLHYSQLKDWNILAKLERLGSPLASCLENLQKYNTYKVVSVSNAPPEDTYDVQIDHEDHEFIVDGFAVHNCIGRYHPHGDSAVYEALCRMAQPFSLRYPLIEGIGNFGSRDGDEAAAMRYTECKLNPIAATMLDELAWDTVDYRPNYDNTTTEPLTLPSRLPMFLLNGSWGVAVGMATSLLSHNLNEAVEATKLVINKKKVSLDEILEVMPGPDFATGARIISSKEEIKKVYEEGKGSLRVRAKWIIEEYGRNNKDWRLIITELPPLTSTAKIMVKINELINPQQSEKSGKKLPLKPEQLRLKKIFSELIDEVTDASDSKNPVYLVIEPKNRSVDKDILTSALCAHTDIEMNVSPNFVCVDLNGTPRQGGIIDWLTQWCDYRIKTLTRRLTDEKKRVDHRLHILEGRLTILDKIDQVIKIIKKSTDPKKDLMDYFGLTEIQAEDVLEMRLRQLANLEKIKLLDEQTKLLAEQSRLQKLLSNDKALRKLLTSELDNDTKAFGDARRTELAPDLEAITKNSILEQSNITLAPDPIAIALTNRGWISWKSVKTITDAINADYKIKTGDEVKRIYFGDRADNLLLLSLEGKAYSLRLLDLPSKSDTLPLTQFFELNPNDKFVEGVIAKPTDNFAVASSAGFGFTVKGSDWINRMKAGKAFLKIEKGHYPLPPHPIDDLSKDSLVAGLSTDGRMVAFKLSELKYLPRGKGVAFMSIANGHKMSDFTIVDNQNAVIVKKDKKFNITFEAIKEITGSRSASKKGKLLHKQSPGSVFYRKNRFIYE